MFTNLKIYSQIIEIGMEILREIMLSLQLKKSENRTK